MLSKLKYFSSIRAVAFLWIGALASAAFSFLLQVLLARNLSVTDYGVFSSAWAIVVLLSPIAGFGVGQFWLKIYGQEGWSAKSWLEGSLLFAKATSLIAILIVIAWAFLGGHDPLTAFVLVFLSSHILAQVFIDLISSKFQLEQYYIRLGVWQCSPAFLRLIVVFILFYFVPVTVDARLVSFGYMLVSALLVLLGIVELRKLKKDLFFLKGHGVEYYEHKVSKSYLDVAREAWPFGLSSILYLVYYQSNIILLKYLVGDAAAGLYNVSFLIIGVVYIFPGVVYQKYLLPKLHRWVNAEKLLFKKVYLRGNVVMFSLGVIAMLFIWGAGSFIVKVFFGSSYSDAIDVLYVLALAAPLRFLIISTGSVLVTEDNMKRKVKYMLIAAIFNVGCGLVFMPIYGLIGAAITAVLCDVLLLGMYLISAKKYVFRNV